MNTIRSHISAFAGYSRQYLRTLGLLVACVSLPAHAAAPSSSIIISNLTVNGAPASGTVTGPQANVSFDYEAKILNVTASYRSQLWMGAGQNSAQSLQMVANGGARLSGHYDGVLPVTNENGRFLVTLHHVKTETDAVTRRKITGGLTAFKNPLFNLAIAAPAQPAVVVNQPAPSQPPPPAGPITLPATTYTAPMNVNPAPAAIDPAKVIKKNSTVTLTGQNGAALGSAQSHFDGYYLLAGSAAEHTLSGSDGDLKSGDIVGIKNNEADNWSGKWQAYKFICIGSTPTLYYYPSSGDSTRWRIWKGGINNSPGAKIQTGDAVTIESMSYQGQWIKPSGDNYTTGKDEGFTFTISKAD